MANMTGTYIRTKEENYEDFLSMLGVSFVLRKAATWSMWTIPTMEITKTGNKWTIITRTILKSVEMNFELGVPFGDISIDGHKYKTTVTMDGDNKLITDAVTTQKGKKSIKVVREFTDKGINVQMICGDVVSKQFFKR